MVVNLHWPFSIDQLPFDSHLCCVWFSSYVLIIICLVVQSQSIQWKWWMSPSNSLWVVLWQNFNTSLDWVWFCDFTLFSFCFMCRLSLIPWRVRQYIPPKHLHPSTRLYDVITQKTTVLFTPGCNYICQGQGHISVDINIQFVSGVLLRCRHGLSFGVNSSII